MKYLSTLCNLILPESFLFSMFLQTSPSRRYHTRSHTLFEDSSPVPRRFPLEPTNSHTCRCCPRQSPHPSLPPPTPMACSKPPSLVQRRWESLVPHATSCPLWTLQLHGIGLIAGERRLELFPAASAYRCALRCRHRALPSSVPPSKSPVPQSNGDVPSNILALILNSPTQTPQTNAFSYPNSHRFSVLLNETASVETSEPLRSAPSSAQTSSSTHHLVSVLSSSLASFQCLQQQFHSQNDLLLRLVRLQEEFLMERASSDRLRTQLTAVRSAGEPLHALLTQLEWDLGRQLEHERASRLSHSTPPLPASRPMLLRDASAQVDGVDLGPSPSHVPLPPERKRRSRDCEAGACQGMPLQVVSASASSSRTRSVSSTNTCSCGRRAHLIVLPQRLHSWAAPEWPLRPILVRDTRWCQLAERIFVHHRRSTCVLLQLQRLALRSGRLPDMRLRPAASHCALLPTFSLQRLTDRRGHLCAQRAATRITRARLVDPIERLDRHSH